MSITLTEILLYSGGLFLLFMTPGPVWVALLARAMSGGFQAAWPLALGVVIGDVIWPLLAIIGVSYLVSVFENFLDLLRYAGAAMFLVMGLLLIKNADKQIGENSSLTKPGMMAGFVAGLLVILGNPKAILFYMGILPGFFDLAAITTIDIIIICALSAAVPLVGNILLALMVDRVRRLLSSPTAVKRLNISAGIALILVGVAIALS